MNTATEFLERQLGKEATHSLSPLMRWLNPVLLSVEEGKLVFQYVVRPEMTNPIGTLHGGITAAIIDDAIGATLFSYGEPWFYTTVNNVIDYLAPARLNDTIIAETSVLKKGRQIVNAQCDVWNADRSRLLARGYSNLMKIDVSNR
ncbi:PaaI family thioesterase [Nibrella viscosa]|uniref:PaaI family thioesterase n=1 Tax=Nibrella viscosa TaxID=1084524 RepID=A0ABP8KL97_9BACT